MNRRAVGARFVRWAAPVLAWSCSRREPPPPPPPPTPAQVDQDILGQAMHQCFTVDCNAAHQRATEIGAQSSLRQSDDFRAIEYRFEVEKLLVAEAEPDVEKRRALLDQLRNDPAADVSLRSTAASRLAMLGTGRRFELALGADAGADGGATADAGESDMVRVARLMRSKKAQDYQAARAILEPKMYEGRMMPEEQRALTVICKAQKDASCVKTLSLLKLR